MTYVDYIPMHYNTFIYLNNTLDMLNYITLISYIANIYSNVMHAFNKYF